MAEKEDIPSKAVFSGKVEVVCDPPPKREPKVHVARLIHLSDSSGNVAHIFMRTRSKEG